MLYGVVVIIKGLSVQLIKCSRSIRIVMEDWFFLTKLRKPKNPYVYIAILSFTTLNLIILRLESNFIKLIPIYSLRVGCGEERIESGSTRGFLKNRREVTTRSCRKCISCY